MLEGACKNALADVVNEPSLLSVPSSLVFLGHFPDRIPENSQGKISDHEKEQKKGTATERLGARAAGLGSRTDTRKGG